MRERGRDHGGVEESGWRDLDENSLGVGGGGGMTGREHHYIWSDPEIGRAHV